MTNDLQQARIEAAAEYLYDWQTGSVGYFHTSNYKELWIHGARQALAAADAHLPSVEMIAEVLDAHLIDRAIKFDSDGYRDWICRCGNKATTDKPHHIHRAEAVRALFAEVAV